ncbi:uncharacterized protein PAC_14689 [Phialocephala subalpina]|uniref:Rhodopsin domain-containing protein n=1 Tax=Phialocephala subalpina TaxID=576137 RepID=A0A1L7XIC9_9HELO|nr:uncharacterized protein PAC_14689 [Phialocephala subalpina]
MAEPYDLHANKGPHVLRIIIAFPILAGICLALRLYTRFKLISNAALEDRFIVVALVRPSSVMEMKRPLIRSQIFSIATSICMGYQVKNGMGRHVQTLTQQDGINSLKFLYASILTYNISLLTIKLSILLQYLRICVNRRVRLACHLTMAFIIAYGIMTFFSGVFTCTPVSYFWDKSIQGGRCVNEPALWFANAGINIFQDVLLLTLPFFILKDLILGTRQKLCLSLVLSLGAFAAIASIIRLHALYNVSISDDITWDNPGTATWSSIEINVAIICTSISVLRPLVSHLFPGIFSSFQNTKSSGGMTSASKTKIKSDKVLTFTAKVEEESRGSGNFERVDDSEREVWGLREVREVERDRMSGGDLEV